MDLPLCKICGQRHRLGGCPGYADPATLRRAWFKGMAGPAQPVVTVTHLPVTPVAKVNNAPEAARPPQVEQHHQAQETQAPPQAKPKFNKTAYQRELMRQRRRDRWKAREPV